MYQRQYKTTHFDLTNNNCNTDAVLVPAHPSDKKTMNNLISRFRGICVSSSFDSSLCVLFIFPSSSGFIGLMCKRHKDQLHGVVYVSSMKLLFLNNVHLQLWLSMARRASFTTSSCRTRSNHCIDNAFRFAKSQ